VEAAGLRSEFPVLARAAYLNTGSMGPAPRAMVDAVCAEMERFVVEGRSMNYFDRMTETQNALRERYAALLGAAGSEVSLETSTSEGVVRVLAGLDLKAGDEVVTSDEEHPGVLGPLGAARRHRGIEVRVVPVAELATAVGPRTKLVACSHVSWLSGSIAPRELADVDVPVLLDGAQGIGAIPVDVHALGCAFYAGSGQKWMCGPVGTGMLWVSPEWRERLVSFAPTYVSIADPTQALHSAPWDDGRAYDASELSVEAISGAIASHDLLAGYGWDEVHGRARDLAARLAEELRQRGRDVLPRGETTLVAWRSDDPEAELERLDAAGAIARQIPGRGVVRASVGAWNDESDLERVLTASG
jgi:L-cysteine/cystine lyase